MPGHLNSGSSKLNRFLNVRRARQVNNVRSNNSIPDNDLVIIKGCLENGKSLRILIDSASQAELITEQATFELNKSMAESNMKLATAQGADMEIKGQVNLNLQIAGHKFDVTTQVVSQLSPLYDIILGIGFLNSHYACLRTKPGFTPIFCIDNTEIPIVQDSRTHGLTILNVSNLTPDVIDFAKSASETYIKPRSKGFIKLAIPNNENF